MRLEPGDLALDPLVGDPAGPLQHRVEHPRQLGLEALCLGAEGGHQLLAGTRDRVPERVFAALSCA